MSKNDDWTTPRKLFDYLDAVINFNLDAAASKNNALCERFLTKKDNALTYTPHYKDRIFCNPPYSLAGEFAKHFLNAKSNCVMLLPVRSDRIWFQQLLHTECIQKCWITGRLHFGGSGKGAFMYSIIMVSGFEKVDCLHMPYYIGAEEFNDNGKGGAKS